MIKKMSWIPSCVRLGGDSDSGDTGDTGYGDSNKGVDRNSPENTYSGSGNTLGGQHNASVGGLAGGEGGVSIGGDTSSGGFEGVDAIAARANKAINDFANIQVDTSKTPGNFTFDLGAVAGATVGFLSGIPGATKMTYELGKKLDWQGAFQTDLQKADVTAADFMDSFEGTDNERKDIETLIRTAKETAVKATPAKDTTLSDEEQKKADRLKRLQSGRGGLLWKNDESGVNKDKLLNTGSSDKLAGLLGG